MQKYTTKMSDSKLNGTSLKTYSIEAFKITPLEAITKVF